ncbi:MAG TPA: DUF3035 domain-containing protein [Magnetospirillaceae bacterium]|jgi:hypothetical protein
MLALPFLTGCGEDTKRELGWEKTPPDEFEVTTRAPLSQPPDYDLRPPAPGAARPQEAATDRAKKVLISSVGGSTANDKASSGNSALDGLSAGEGALIKKAGAENATSAIRKQVDEETTALVEEGNSFTDDILFWQKKPEPGEIIDPVKEQQRLEVNASLGKSATDGDSPQITRRQRGWLEGIF